MAVIDIHVLTNTAFQVFDVPDPNTNEIVARRLELIDKQTGEAWHFSVNLEGAQRLGQQMMGLSNITIANGTDVNDILKGLGDQPGRKG